MASLFRRNRKAPVVRSQVGFGFQSLEERAVPATFTVNTLADDVTANTLVSLREAIQASNASAGADTIVFDKALTGTLTASGAAVAGVATTTVLETVTITGPGANVLGVNLGANSLNLTGAVAGTVLTVSGLTLTGTGATVATTDTGTGTTLNLNSVEVTGGTTANVTATTGNVVNINSTTLRGNAINVSQAGTAQVNIVNSTIANGTKGVDIAAATTGATNISNSTISGNGTGIVNGTATANTVTLSSTIVAGNTTADYTGVTVVQTSNNNLIGVQGGSGLINGNNSNQVGTAGIPVNANLGPLTNNGGSTQTFLIQAGSPAIDKGVANGLTSDQRGTARVVGASADIGSTESGGVAPLPPAQQAAADAAAAAAAAQVAAANAAAAQANANAAALAAAQAQYETNLRILISVFIAFPGQITLLSANDTSLVGNPNTVVIGFAGFRFFVDLNNFANNAFLGSI